MFFLDLLLILLIRRDRRYSEFLNYRLFSYIGFLVLHALS